MGPISLSRGSPPVDRTSDRVIAVSSVAAAIAFVGAAGLAWLLPDQTRHGLWLPIHLALAGGAATAIAGVMPFFVAAFAAAPPADARLRAAAVAGVSIGALGVASGVALGPDWLAAAGGITFIAGIVLTGVAALRPVRGGLGPSRGLVTRMYLVALVAVASGASLATALLAGWPPIASAWAQLKPAHAWLNLFGFASLAIATTLLHFFPTVVGARIPNHASARLAVGGLASGTWLVALGYAGRIDVAVALGGSFALIGGIALGWYELRVWRVRAAWTTDGSWHAFAIGGLISATCWFVVGLAIAAVGAISHGADPSGWSIGAVVGPLVAGWVGLAILASATHLLPAIGPGDPATHARQRQLLGHAAIPRLVALDAGVALLVLGAPGYWSWTSGLAAALLAAGYGTTAALLAAGVGQGLRWTRSRSRPPA